MKVFLDTNVLVVAFATRGLCEDVVRVVLTEHELIVGTHVVVEFEHVLIDKLGLTPRKAATVRSFLKSQSRLVDPQNPTSWPKNDPEDRWVAAAALKGGAEILVTGDRDLLLSADKSPISIVTPRDFWAPLPYANQATNPA